MKLKGAASQSIVSRLLGGRKRNQAAIEAEGGTPKASTSGPRVNADKGIQGAKPTTSSSSRVGGGTGSDGSRTVYDLTDASNVHLVRMIGEPGADGAVVLTESKSEGLHLARVGLQGVTGDTLRSLSVRLRPRKMARFELRLRDDAKVSTLAGVIVEVVGPTATFWTNKMDVDVRIVVDPTDGALDVRLQVGNGKPVETLSLDILALTAHQARGEPRRGSPDLSYELLCVVADVGSGAADDDWTDDDSPAERSAKGAAASSGSKAKSADAEEIDVGSRPELAVIEALLVRMSERVALAELAVKRAEERAKAAENAASGKSGKGEDVDAERMNQRLAKLQQRADELRDERNVARTARSEARAEAKEMRGERDKLALELKRKSKELESLVTKFDKTKESMQAANRRLREHAVFTDCDFFLQERQRDAMRDEVAAKLAAGTALTVRESEVRFERLAAPVSRRLPVRSVPPKSVAFLTVANDRFIPGLIGMLRSLLEVYPTFESDLYVCHDGTLTEFAQRSLKRIYPGLIFLVPDMSWMEEIPETSNNHKRIGVLGYMNLAALTLEGYSQIVLLDSDILVLDDISELWNHQDEFVVCYDVGDREYVVKSEFTGRFVLNSGVISVPGSAANPDFLERAKQVARDYAVAEICPAIDRFADQKIWNILLKDERVHYAPVNYNCNIKYLVRSLAGNFEGISIVHFAGPKPWNSKDYNHDDHLTEEVGGVVRHHKLWQDKYRSLVYAGRLAEYAAWARDFRRRDPVRPESVHDGRKTCVMIGNGPSIAKTDLASLAHYERFVFNWFILHDDFDVVKPDHLVLASHMFYGGWFSSAPAFPPGYLDRLRQLQHKPVIWTSFFFRDLVEIEGLDKEFEVNYVLFEKPFKRFVDKTGRYNADIDGFLDDARTGVLSAGVPVALGLGFEEVVLVGCDSNYNQNPDQSKYFYNTELHSSAETNAASLTATWTAEGRGQYVYQVVAEELESRGCRLVDCTVDGALTDIPKGRVEDYGVSPAEAPVDDVTSLDDAATTTTARTGKTGSRTRRAAVSKGTTRSTRSRRNGDA